MYNPTPNEGLTTPQDTDSDVDIGKQSIHDASSTNASTLKGSDTRLRVFVFAIHCESDRHMINLATQPSLWYTSDELSTVQPGPKPN
jgi:hypothetical protein